MDSEDGPPASVSYGLEEALELLATLEVASDTFHATGHYVGLIEIDAQIRLLSHRLGFDDGEADGD